MDDIEVIFEAFLGAALFLLIWLDIRGTKQNHSITPSPSSKGLALRAPPSDKGSDPWR
jgi:hypothetical protein